MSTRHVEEPARSRARRSFRGFVVARTVAIVVAVTANLAGCAEADDTDRPAPLGIHPAWVPPPHIPDDEPLTQPVVALGRHLFHDRRLSREQNQSCADCHQQALAFTDGRTTGLGSLGDSHFRNSMTLVNVAWNSSLTWSSNTVLDLSEQAMLPLFGEEPVELGMSGREPELLERLRSDPTYVQLFADAWPDEGGTITLDHALRAIASFQRTIVSWDAPWDRWAQGRDRDAVGDDARRGADLFFGEKFECFHCHGGPNFSDAFRTRTTAPRPESAMHNTALYALDALGSYPAIDNGLYDLTFRDTDRGRFRTPTLRNIAVTAPYFHDGSAATLDDVLDHYDQGGRRIDEGPYAGDGATNPNRSPFVRPIGMTEAERADLKAFLLSLTDETLLTRPDLANPWPAGHAAHGAPLP